MPVTSVRKDPAALTMTLDAEFAAPPERVWRLWEDPRQLERWWGPPTHPATFERLDLHPGGRAAYYMTGPDGERYHGWWQFIAVDAPRRIELEDGFGDANGDPHPDMPVTRMVVTISAIETGSRMELRTTFPSAEAMEQLVAMGMDEGITGAVNQIDAILTEGGSDPG